jgi:hypothetical protein
MELRLSLLEKTLSPNKFVEAFHYISTMSRALYKKQAVIRMKSSKNLENLSYQDFDFVAMNNRAFVVVHRNSLHKNDLVNKKAGLDSDDSFEDVQKFDDQYLKHASDDDEPRTVRELRGLVQVVIQVLE